MFYVITGGSGSGKSAYAENCIVNVHDKSEKKNRLVYIATMEPYGAESQKKIERHRKMREGKGFQTMECYRNLSEADQTLLNESCVLLECMSNLAANEFYGRVLHEGMSMEEMREETVEALWEGVDRLRETSSHLVVVTNEIGSECGILTKEMEQYKKIMGEINRRMAEHADKVIEVVYGIPVEVK